MALISQARQAGVPWFGHVLCWQEDTIDAYLRAVWEPHYREAWVLISDELIHFISKLDRPLRRICVIGLDE